jgi:O-antigen ligase
VSSVPLRAGAPGPAGGRRAALGGLTPPPAAVVAVLVPLAAAIGGLIALNPTLGLAGALAVAFAAFVLLALPAAIGAWVVIAFASGLPGLMGLPAASTLLVGVAWLATLPSRREHVAALRSAAPLVLLAPWVLFGWMILTAIWAPDRAVATSQLWLVFTALVTVPIIITGADTLRTVRILVAAYVGGAAMVVALALILGPASYVAGDHSEGRLEVANFSANLLGAVCATALVLVPALWPMARTRARRALVLVAGALVAYGLVGSESRSGFIALGVAVVAALVICRGRRRAILGAMLAGLVVLGAFVALNPGILDRTSSGDSTGTGRTELWKAGLEVARDHPLAGVGIGNFIVVSPSYAQQVGTVKYTEVLIEDPKPVHNTVIEAVAETGFVGLALLVAAIGLCMSATVRAVRRFRRIGRDDLELLAQLVLVAQIAILAAGMFLPMTYSRQLWMLLAIGPALLGIALRTSVASAHAPAPAPTVPGR